MRRECVTRIAIARDESGSERGGPEAIARPCEADACVGRVEAWVETTHEQAHAMVHEVRQRSCARRMHVDPFTAVIRNVVNVEAGSGQDLAERLRFPLGEEPPGEAVVCERTFIRPVAECERGRS